MYANFYFVNSVHFISLFQLPGQMKHSRFCFSEAMRQGLKINRDPVKLFAVHFNRNSPPGMGVVSCAEFCHCQEIGVLLPKVF